LFPSTNSTGNRLKATTGDFLMYLGKMRAVTETAHPFAYNQPEKIKSAQRRMRTSEYFILLDKQIRKILISTTL
jgi:hypothetical protein